MIRPPGFAGAAFGTSDSGDLRTETERRKRIAAGIGIPSDWAFVHQVHSSTVIEANSPGLLGDADAIVTERPRLPIAVATADCVPLIVEAEGAVAVVHAGWRGAVAGIVPVALQALTDRGHLPLRAAIGPGIGPCCYEVGAEVADRFPGFTSKTTWGSMSVDIAGFLESQLTGLDVWRSDECTFTSDTLHSWRRDRTQQRQVAVAWLPSN